MRELIGGYRHHYRVTRIVEPVKAMAFRYTLPPGRFLVLDPEEETDQKFLIKHAAKVGPIFRTVFDSQLCICVIGLSRCRRLLQENSANLAALSRDLRGLFPEGFLRQMEGDVHQKYKRATVKAIDPTFISRHAAELEGIVADELAHYADHQEAGISSPEKYEEVLNNVSSALLILVFFGARAGTKRFEALERMYDALGANGDVWCIGEPQKQSFFEIRDYLNAQLAGQGLDDDPYWQQSIIGRMHNNGALDETSLGNLIYMVEIGRHDLQRLFRWLSKYGAENSEILRVIAAGTAQDALDKEGLSRRFVLETLRLNQSERLMRIVSRDIEFDGYRIPKNFMVRLCMWESHKSPDLFPEPFSFRPERFVNNAVGKDRFSPFGMDHHRCPLADISISLSALFLSVLARSYEVHPVGDGPPVRGEFHWEPARSFSVGLRGREL